SIQVREHDSNPNSTYPHTEVTWPGRTERMANKLVGQNYQTPDLVAKVTGRAKYVEDYVANGMLYARCSRVRCRTHVRGGLM
ncbi:MAG: hypothetical protein QM736_04825, partial [Vicinamibacterales bacterium]